MQTTCPPGLKNCSLAYCHSELHGRGSRLGIRGHRSYHTTDTPQLLEIRNFQLRAAPPEPGSRYTRIPADVMQGALPIILNLLPQRRVAGPHSLRPVFSSDSWLYCSVF